MMMIYGMMPFMRQTLPYGELQQNIDYRWPTNNRVGQRPAAQFIGPGDEKITLSGELRPEITGGAISLMTIRLLADQGMAANWRQRHDLWHVRYREHFKYPQRIFP